MNIRSDEQIDREIKRVTDSYRRLIASQQSSLAVAYVSEESFSSDGTSDIMTKNLPIGTALFTAPPAPAVPDDYFGELVKKARSAADKAMRKFPQPNYVLNKVAEESGEVIKAVIHYTEGREEWSNVEGEIIDNLAMLIRLVVEGDQVIGFTPPDACRAAMLSHVGDATDKVEPVMICDMCGHDADHQGNRTYKCDNGHVFHMHREPVSQGYKLLEPTANMQAAGAAAIRFDTTPINKLFTANAVYRAMQAAAPEAVTK